VDYDITKNSEAIIEELHRAYDISATLISRHYGGYGTTNWIAKTDNGVFFIKQYGDKFNAQKEIDALRLTEYAHSCNIPTPRIIEAKSGELLNKGGQVNFTVFEYVEGSVSNSLSGKQMRPAGQMLGKIHKCFRNYASKYDSATHKWLSTNINELKNGYRRYLRLIKDKKEKDEFDKTTFKYLVYRSELADRLLELLKISNKLSSQVIHSDYSPLNLIFKNDDIIAVIDFNPPEPFLLSYEIGRIALDPRNFTDGDWLNKGVELIDEYCKYNELALEDIKYSPRIWLVQLMKSLYGLRQHYFESVELQQGLDDFWLYRNEAIINIYDNLEELESSFEEIWTRHNR